jgi:hypothetical protein
MEVGCYAEVVVKHGTSNRADSRTGKGKEPIINGSQALRQIFNTN